MSSFRACHALPWATTSTSLVGEMRHSQVTLFISYRREDNQLSLRDDAYTQQGPKSKMNVPKVKKKKKSGLMSNSTSFFAGQVVLVGYYPLWTLLSPFNDPPFSPCLSFWPTFLPSSNALEPDGFCCRSYSCFAPIVQRWDLHNYKTTTPSSLFFFSFFSVPYPFHRNNQSQKTQL